MDECLLCGEEIHDLSLTVGTIGADGQPRLVPVHHECNLREVMGGIGHIIAHPYWCKERHDPDAGLTYRQSAMLVYSYVRLVGVESATERGSIST